MVLWNKYSSYTREIRCFKPRIFEQQFSLFLAIKHFGMAHHSVVIFLRKAHFVILTAYVLVIENQTFPESCNTMAVALQNSHLLQGLYLAKLLLTVTLTELLACSVTLAKECGTLKHLLISYPSCSLHLWNTVLARCLKILPSMGWG